MLGLGLGLVLGLFSALLDMFRTRSPTFDGLQRRNNSHGLSCCNCWRIGVRGRTVGAGLCVGGPTTSDATASTYDDKLSPDRCRARLTPSSTPSVRHPTSCPSVRPPNNTIWSPTPDAHSATRKSGHSNGARRADRIAACCPPLLVTHTHTHTPV